MVDMIQRSLRSRFVPFRESFATVFVGILRLFGIWKILQYWKDEYDFSIFGLLEFI